MMLWWNSSRLTIQLRKLGDGFHLWHFAWGSIPRLFDMALGKEKYVLSKNELKFIFGSVFDFPGWLWYKISPRKYEKYMAWRYPANEIHTSLRIRKI